MQTLRQLTLEAYDRFIGRQLSDLAVDCCITKAPCGGEKAGKSPVDRGKGGIKRSTVVDGGGIPLGTVTAPANRHDDLPLLEDTLDSLGALGELPDQASAHLDRAYDSNTTRQKLEARGLNPVICVRKASRLRWGLPNAAGSWNVRTPGGIPPLARTRLPYAMLASPILPSSKSAGLL